MEESLRAEAQVYLAGLLVPFQSLPTLLQSRQAPPLVMQLLRTRLAFDQLAYDFLSLADFRLNVPGIGETSALQILGELVVLSDTADARQWVAFSGLDPCTFTSGSSVEKRPRISRGGSRHLGHALYMPALVALRREPNLRRFYQRLLSRGKARLQAVVAVMRKLLHALFAMFRTNQPYDGSKLCSPEPTVSHKVA